MKKKIISLLLCAAMTVGMITGCGDNTNEKTSSVAKTEESNATVSSESNAEESKVEESKGVIKGELDTSKKLELTAWYTYGTEFIRKDRLSENLVNDWLVEQTNVDIENLYGNDGGAYDIKFSKLYAGDNLPDIVLNGGGSGRANLKIFEEGDLLWRFSYEDLEKYAPNVIERAPEDLLAEYEDENGLLVGIPGGFQASPKTIPYFEEEHANAIANKYNTNVADVPYYMVIRDDILQMLYPDAMSWEDFVSICEEDPSQLNGDLLCDIPITTTEEYIQFLYDIKNLGLKTENGHDVYAYGYGSADMWDFLCYLGASMYGYNNIYYTGYYNVDEDRYVYPLMENGVIKEAARVQNQLLRDGVIDQESVVGTADMFKEKALNGEYAIFNASYISGDIKGVNEACEAAGVDYRYRPLYISIAPQPGYKPTTKVAQSQTSIGFTKELTEQEFIQVLNWVNVMWSEEFDDVYCWGPKEAGLYVENADGTRTFTDDKLQDYFLGSNAAGLTALDLKGLNENTNVGEYYFTATNTKPYYPMSYNKDFTYSEYQATKFASTSEHTKNVAIVPLADSWEGAFTVIDEVNEFWASRQTWEDAFKLAFAASSEEEFEKKWTDAQKILSDLVDVKVMEEECTKICHELMGK